MRYPETIMRLTAKLQKLPGIGRKTAEKFAFHMIDWSKEEIKELTEALLATKTLLKRCPTCFALFDQQHCRFCDIASKTARHLCIVSNPKNIYTIESTHLFSGVYHVLKSLLSPINGKMIDEKEIEQIKQRLENDQIEEVILALDSTLEGDATALYLQHQLKATNVTVSRLAVGLPMGSSLDYIDEETLHLALLGRTRCFSNS